ncbi:SDR family NAD(P)-dependent oxidoreductase [Streptomyces milbemycinicus]|uniref:SDR family NAD(P)-dependent oxidoreductase n=1 Tax=Streptomyces milbemycinicus TaxID=476552 RepID=UPI0033DE7F74
MSSIAIVGAGPGMGLAIARTFGSHGFDVALIARNRDKLNDLVGRLEAEGITAAAFPADVLDHDALTQALKDAATRFGGIDVLEYSPAGSLESTTLTAPSETNPSDVQWAMDFLLYGAIAATRAVLPAMREAGAGTLLYTNGAGSVSSPGNRTPSGRRRTAGTCVHRDGRPHPHSRARQGRRGHAR